MSDDMNFDLRSGIVSILYNKATAGTGFVISNDGLIATCAHVVQSDREQRRGVPPPATCTLIFRVSDEQREAEVVHEWWRASYAEDVAILRVKGGLPEGVRPLMAGFSHDVAGRSIKTFGFPPPNQEQGIWGKGRAVGPTSDGVVPVIQVSSKEITPGFSGAPVVIEYSDGLSLVIGMVTSITPTDDFGRQGEVAFLTPIETLRSIGPALNVSAICPYLGLETFTEEHSTFFFGRQQVVHDLLDSLRKGNRFLALLGHSGSGKSSVVRAGLIPLLRQDALPGSSRWGIIVTRPGDNPFKALSAQGIIADTKNLKTGIRDWLKQQNKERLVLVIDQGEELFVSCPEELRQDFIQQLGILLDNPAPITIILTMRVDFYSYATRYTVLAKWLGSSAVNIATSLLREDVIDIIQKPAQAVGLSVSNDLTTTIVHDLQSSAPDEQGTGIRSTILPLLEFVLKRVWDKCYAQGILTSAAYNSLGGVTGSLSQWADSVLFELDETQLQLAHHIFTALVHLGDERQGLPDARQRRPLTVLVRHAAEKDAVLQLVQLFVQKRLLVTGRDEQTKEDTVELIHDSLIREWTQLKLWLHDDRDFLSWHQRLQARKQDWIEANKDDVEQQDSSGLLSGLALVTAEHWLNERKADLSDEEQNFIQASLKDAQRWKELYEEAERQRQIALARGLQAQAELLLNQYPHLVERSVLLTIESLRRYPLAEAHQLLRYGTALLRRRLRVFAHQSSVTCVAYSPDGHLLATSSWDKTVSIWEVSTGNQLLSLRPQDAINAVAFSPDSRLLATGSGNSLRFQALIQPELAASADTTHDGMVQIWEVSSGGLLQSILHQFQVNAVAFSPDGRLLATGSGSSQTWGMMQLWDVSTGSLLSSLGHQTWVTSLAFSADGEMIATGSGGMEMAMQKQGLAGIAQVWDTATGHLRFSLPHQGSVDSVAFSSTVPLLATASVPASRKDLGQIFFWELTGGRLLTFYSHQKRVQSLAFDPSAKMLAAACEDGSVTLWGIDMPHRMANLPHYYNVRSIAYSPDGNFLVAGGGSSEMGNVQLWETKNTTSFSITLPHMSDVRRAVFSPEGHLLATTSANGTTGVWDGNNGRCIATFTSQTSQMFSGSDITFSPDGRWLAVAGGDALLKGRIELFDVLDNFKMTSATEQSIINLLVFSPDGDKFAVACVYKTVGIWQTNSPECLLTLTTTNTVKALAFSPDGELLATAQEKSVCLWNSSSGQLLLALEHEWDVVDVAFSPNGHLLAAATADSRFSFWKSPTDPPAAYPVCLWELPGGHLHASAVHQEEVNKVVFSSDGAYFATACANSTKIWKTRDGSHLADLSHEGSVKTIAFSPDGHVLATASADNTACLWEIPSGRQIARFVHMGTVNSVAFSPDGRYLATASADGNAYIWLWHSEDLIAEAQARLTRNLTQEEWSQYIGKEPYRKTVPDLPG